MKKLNVVIRTVKLADLPHVFRLARVDELRAANHQFAEQWWIRDFLKSRQPFFVATLNSHVVGFILGECATGKVAIQHLIAVEPKYRHRGIGKQLKLAFEREVRRRGITCILLYMSGSKHWAHHLEHHGYARGSLVREYQKFL